MTVFREQFFSKTQLFRFSVELISRSTDPAATAVFKRPSSLQVLEPPSRIEPSNHGRQSSVEGMQALRNRVVGRDVCHLPLGGRRHRTVDDLMGVMVASIHRCCVVFWRVWGWVCKLHGCFNRTLSYLILYIYLRVTMTIFQKWCSRYPKYDVSENLIIAIIPKWRDPTLNHDFLGWLILDDLDGKDYNPCSHHYSPWFSQGIHIFDTTMLKSQVASNPSTWWGTWFPRHVAAGRWGYFLGDLGIWWGDDGD